MNLYTKEDYAKSYTELLEILKYVSYEYINKIPKENLSYYESNKDINYTYSYNPQLSFENQNILRLTKILLANLYIDYWTTEEEHIQIENSDRKELYAIEMQKKSQYPTNNLFSKKSKAKDFYSPETSIAVVDSKNIFLRIFNKIKKIFKLT